MPRKRLEWKLKQRAWLLGERVLLGAILDVSPDGQANGAFEDPDAALARAIALSDGGADFLEITPAPLSPGKARVVDAEEIRRLVPVLKRLRGKIGIPVAVETTYGTVAEKAIEYGAEILHDPSGLTFDPTMGKVASNADAGVILSHLRGKPEAWPKLPPVKDPAGTMVTEMRAAMSRASRGGVQPKRIVLDPGLGQAKRKEGDHELVAQFGRMTQLEVPISMSASRRSSAPTQAEEAVLATVAILAGAHIVRTHDFEGLRAALLLASSMVYQGA